jgi:hypothetical protein
MWPGLPSNSQSCYLSLPSPGIIGMHCHARLPSTLIGEPMSAVLDLHLPLFCLKRFLTRSPWSYPEPPLLKVFSSLLSFPYTTHAYESGESSLCKGLCIFNKLSTTLDQRVQLEAFFKNAYWIQPLKPHGQ